MGSAHLARRQSVGCLKVLGFEGSREVAFALGNQVVFTATRGDSQPSWPGQPPSQRPELTATSSPWPGRLLGAPGQLAQVAMTQAFHLQNGTDDSSRLPTHPWGHSCQFSALPHPKNSSKAELKSRDLLL